MKKPSKQRFLMKMYSGVVKFSYKSGNDIVECEGTLLYVPEKDSPELMPNKPHDMSDKIHCYDIITSKWVEFNISNLESYNEV